MWSKIRLCLTGLLLGFALLLLPAAPAQASTTAYSYTYYKPLADGSCRVGLEYTPGVTSSNIKSVAWKSGDTSVLAANGSSTSTSTPVIFLKKGSAAVTRTITLTNGNKIVTTYNFLIFKKNTWVSEDGYKYYYLTTGGYATDTWIGSRYVDTQGRYDRHFQKSSDGVRYLKGDGTYAKSEWLTARDGSVYYFDDKQLMVTGKWVGGSYLQKDGKKKSGLVKTAKGWQLSGSDSSAGTTSYQTSCWATINGKKVYFNDSGVPVKGKWKTIDGKKYYFNANGYLVTDKWVGNYYVGADGYRLTNQRVGNYYVNSSGKKCASRWINGYYVNAKGKVQKNKWINGVYVGLAGRKISGMKYTTGKTAVNGACLVGTKSQLNKLVKFAKSKLGTPYLWGGISDKDYDCSGLITACYQSIGITIPRTTYYQINAGVEIDKDDPDEWQIGDLLVRKGSADGSGGHVMMYIGDGYVIQSTTGGVQITPLASASSFEKVKRIIYVK